MDKKTAEHMEEKVKKFKDFESRKKYLEFEIESLTKRETEIQIRRINDVNLKFEQKKLIKEFIIDVINEEIVEIEKKMEEI